MDQLPACPFCGSAIKHVESMARSFDPPRVYHEWHHPENDCILPRIAGKSILWAGTDVPKTYEDFLTGWSNRVIIAPASEDSRGPGMRLTLNGIKRKGDHCVKFWLMQGMRVRIWSGEHSAWWRPDRAGYTTHIEAAGVYDFDDAYNSTSHCGPEKKIEYHEVRA